MVERRRGKIESWRGREGECIGGRGMQWLCPSTSLKPDPGLRIPTRLPVVAAPLRHPRHPQHPPVAPVYRALLVRLLFRQVLRKRLEDPPIVLAIKAVVLTLFFSVLCVRLYISVSLSISFHSSLFCSLSFFLFLFLSLWREKLCKGACKERQSEWFARIQICPRVTFPREK